MEEAQKVNLFETVNGIISDIVRVKKENPKTAKKLNKFKARINLGLQYSKNEYYWLNLKAKEGVIVLERDKLDKADLDLKGAAMDFMLFCNGGNSLMDMVLKKNEYGDRKLRWKPLLRKARTLLKFASILVIA